MTVHHAKVLVVGPPGAGKTILCKYILSRNPEDLDFLERNGDEKEFEQFKLDLASEGDTATYPLRIHERDLENFQLSSGQMTSSHLQIWDCSGDLERMRDKLEALCLNINGVVLVYNPGRQGHGELLDQWYRDIEGFLPNNCEKLVYPYKIPDLRQNQRAIQPKTIGRIRCVEDCNTFDREAIIRMQSEFDQMIRKILDRQVSRREKQEQSIMNG